MTAADIEAGRRERLTRAERAREAADETRGTVPRVSSRPEYCPTVGEYFPRTARGEGPPLLQLVVDEVLGTWSARGVEVGVQGALLAVGRRLGGRPS